MKNMIGWIKEKIDALKQFNSVPSVQEKKEFIIACSEAMPH